MKGKIARACVGSAAAVLTSGPAFASGPLHRVGLSSQNVHPYAISADGRVVVGYASGITYGDAFRWTAATGIVGLGAIGDPLGSGGRSARAASADGAVIVGFGSSTAGTEAFRWTQATGMVGLGILTGDPNEAYSEAWGVSGDGTIIAGASSDGFVSEAFRWTESTGLVPLGQPAGWFDCRATAISADGVVIAGYGLDPTFIEQPFIWTDGAGMVPFGEPGWSSIRPQAVSADGAVIVGYGVSANGNEAFRWTLATGIVGLGDLPGDIFSSEAYAVSADGSIVVGTSASEGYGYEAFIWDATHGMRSLIDVLAIDYGYDTADWVLYSARGISASGLQIVGRGYSATENGQGWIVHLPVPGTPIPGDMNCDGDVNFGDINAFVLALTGGQGEYRDQYPDCSWYGADVNQDGWVGFGDINPFVAILVGS